MDAPTSVSKNSTREQILINSGTMSGTNGSQERPPKEPKDQARAAFERMVNAGRVRVNSRNNSPAQKQLPPLRSQYSGVPATARAGNRYAHKPRHSLNRDLPSMPTVDQHGVRRAPGTATGDLTVHGRARYTRRELNSIANERVAHDRELTMLKS